MSFDSLNLTTKQYQKSMKYLGEAKINMSLRRIERAIDYLNKDLKFRESIQTRKRHRVHKGAAYYNLGLCHLFEEKRDMNKVVLNFLLAYIEDGLSSHPVVGHAESGEAARMLRVNLKINPGYLMTIGVLICYLLLPLQAFPRSAWTGYLSCVSQQMCSFQGRLRFPIFLIGEEESSSEGTTRVKLRIF